MGFALRMPEAATLAAAILRSETPLFHVPGSAGPEPFTAAMLRASMPELLRSATNHYRHRLNQQMQDPTADDQSTAFKILDNLLLWEKLSALKVVGRLRSDSQQNVGLVLTEPHVVFCLDFLLHFQTRRETLIGYMQLADTTEREGLEYLTLDGSEIPNALVVDQSVRFERAALVRIAKAATVVLPDGLIQLMKLGVLWLERLVVVPFHEETALTQGIEESQQEAPTTVWKQLVDPSERGKRLQVLGSQLAPVLR